MLMRGGRVAARPLADLAPARDGDKAVGHRTPGVSGFADALALLGMGGWIGSASRALGSHPIAGAVALVVGTGVLPGGYGITFFLAFGFALAFSLGVRAALGRRARARLDGRRSERIAGDGAAARRVDGGVNGGDVREVGGL